MPEWLPLVFGITVLLACTLHFLFRRSVGRRLRSLERDLQVFSAAMYQMAEIQMKSYQKLSGNLGEFEERLLDLSLPARDVALPLERRHQVLALARKGAALEEIVQRLKVPRGEAELILSLKSYTEAGAPPAEARRPEWKTYAQA